MIPPNRHRPAPPVTDGGRPTVLVVGAYLADRPTKVGHIWRELSRATRYRVRQHWASVGPDDGIARPVPVALALAERVPKYAAINALLAQASLASAEYLVVCDDDIGLPSAFLDRFLDVQTRLGFALAQPARSVDSSCDHPIVLRVDGALARQTLFVETGPCFSVHRSVFPLVLPFDLTSPMGWGYEYVWAARLAERGYRMGIVDATPVQHTDRAVGAHYDRDQAYQAQQRFLAANRHLDEPASHRVLRVFRSAVGRERADGDGRDLRRHPPRPR